MNILNYMLKCLGNSVLHVQAKHDLQKVPDNIVLLDGNTSVPAESICIGGTKEIFCTIKNFAVPRETIFFTPSNPGNTISTRPNVNIVETSLDLIPLYNKLNNALISLNNALFSPSESAFDVFFRNAINMELSTGEEIQSGLYELEYTSKDPYNIIVIETMDPDVLRASFEDIKTDVLRIFPTSNATLFSNRLVVMYQHPGRMIHLPDETLGAFTEVLARYDAHAGISNHTRNFEMIRTEYIIAKSILRIAKGMFNTEKRRVFTQEEHGTFYIMDLCYRQCEQIFHHSNMLYLCHPGLAALIRYDTENKTNLRKVLLCYLLNDRSLAQTSRILFMHRNTVMNKISKITEIIDDDLNDALIRQRLLFSCLFYDYCEKYKQNTFTMLPVDEAEPPASHRP